MDAEILRQLGEGRLAELRRDAAGRARASEAMTGRRRGAGVARRARRAVGGALMSAGALVAGGEREAARTC